VPNIFIVCLFFQTHHKHYTMIGMNSDMCDHLTLEYSIFLTRDGRISLAGLNEKNVAYVAKAIHSVTDGKSITNS
jgi:aspartate aminotransferase